MSLDEVNKLMSKLEDLKRKSDRTDGMIAQIEVALSKEFGVSNLEDAKELFERKTEELSQLEEELSTATQQWREDWGGYYDL